MIHRCRNGAANLRKNVMTLPEYILARDWLNATGKTATVTISGEHFEIVSDGNHYFVDAGSDDDDFAFVCDDAGAANGIVVHVPFSPQWLGLIDCGAPQTLTHDLVKSQLAWAAQQITADPCGDGRAHWEWSDDGWDYLHAALNLASLMMDLEMNADNDGWHELLAYGLNDYACDGICPAIYDLKPPALSDAVLDGGPPEPVMGATK